MTDRYDGDTLITLSGEGADYNFKGGDPVRDQGFINHINISTLTPPGWAGNDLEPIETRKVNSKYIGTARGALTRDKIIDINRAAELDVSGPEFGNVLAQTTNPASQQILTDIFVQPPTDDIVALRLLGSGQNWLNQILNPIPEGAEP